MRDCVRMMARDKIAGYGQEPDTETEDVCDELVPVQGWLSMLSFNINNTSGSISIDNNECEKRPSTAKQQ